MRVLLLVALLPVAACVDADAPHSPGDDAAVELVVPPGSTAKGLGDTLVELDLVDSAWSWKWFLRSADGSCLKAGRFEVRRSMSPRELLDTLCGPPLPEDVPFTVVEGWRIDDIDAALVQAKLIQPGQYAEVARTKTVTAPFEVPGPTLEGYLYPETYRVEPRKFEVKAFVERQLTTFHERFGSTFDAAATGRSLHDVVVMASMLEREEPTPANRPLVAGILWKRLDSAWNLGVDATSRYTLTDWNNRETFLAKLRDPSDVYNTRLRPGLPPTAIGNPGVEALTAASNPTPSEWWYYLHDGNGVIHPARDKAGHEANRRQYNVY